jgi:aerobic-type carbon monoxide dehydrogenase small subunit (CoxS/CutS family)
MTFSQARHPTKTRKINGTETPHTAFLTYGAVQCGYCTPGMVMAAEGHLRANPDGDRAAIRHALAGNICRCTGFALIVDAVESEAERRLADLSNGAEAGA